MKFIRLILAIVAFGYVSPAAAQWQTPSHSSPVGKGAGFTGFASVGPCAGGIPLVGGGTASDPTCGPLNLAASGAVTGKLPSANIDTSGAVSWFGDWYFGSGRPWCDVRAKGAVGDGTTDDSAAVAACVTVVQFLGTGGEVYFPPTAGLYCIKSMITVASAPAVVFRGATQSVTVASCAADITVFKLNAYGSGIENLRIYGKGTVGLPVADTVFGASNPTVWLAPNCVNCMLNHIQVGGGSPAIKAEGGDFKMFTVDAGGAYGAGATASVVYVTAGGWMQQNAFDQNWPVSLPSYPLTANNWAATTAYATGQVAIANDPAGHPYYIQCLTSGTSGGSSPALKNYNANITDGTAVWLLVAPTTYYGLQIDTGASEVSMVQQDLSGPYTGGLAMTNTLGGTPPNYVSIGTGSVIGQGFVAGVYATAGNELIVDGAHIAGGISSGSFGVLLSNSFSGRARITNNTFLTGTGNGVAVQAGLSSIIANNHINTSGGNGVVISPNVNDFIIIGNTLEPNNQNGIVVQAGTSDHYTILGNINAGVTGSMYINGATGTDKLFAATTSGNSSKLATTTGVLTNGHCASWDASGNAIDSGSACGTLTPGGSNTQVQYNNAGALGGITGATTNGVTLTLVAPVLGTPASATLTNATNLPIATGVSGLAAGIATWLATSSSANLRAALTDETGTGAAYFQGGDIGTPSAGVGTNITGVPIATGVSGLGTSVATWLATASSANLRAALTDETGTGLAYFQNGALGTPSSGTGTNLTGIPISTGLTGAGTGVLGALANGIDTSGGVATVGSFSANDIAVFGTSGSPIVGGTGCNIQSGGSIQCSTSSSSLPQYVLTNTANNLGSAVILFKKSRAVSDTSSGDFISDMEYLGFASGSYQLAGREQFIQSGASVGANIPTRYELSTSNSAGSANQKIIFNEGAHLGISTQATATTISAGCNGAGFSVGAGSSDFHGWATGQTAPATTCTVHFGTAFANRPSCTVSGEQTAILTMAPTTTDLVITFAALANYKFDWHCMGL